jgi:hypothetical protein
MEPLHTKRPSRRIPVVNLRVFEEPVLTEHSRPLSVPHMDLKLDEGTYHTMLWLLGRMHQGFRNKALLAVHDRMYELLIGPEPEKPEVAPDARDIPRYGGQANYRTY